MHRAVVTSACCSNLVRTVSYETQLAATRQDAAGFYYSQADALAVDTTANGIRQQCAALQKVVSFVPDYRDAADRLNQLFGNNSFVVAFNPVEDTLFFNDRGFTARMFTYSNDYFVKTLIKKINPEKSGIGFLLLLSWEECKAQGLQPDWLVDLRLPQLYATTIQETRMVTRQVSEPAGTDSTGKPIYKVRMVGEEQVCEVISDSRTVLQIEITNMADGNNVFRDSFETSFRYSANTNNECLNQFNDTRLSRTADFFPLSLREYAVNSMYTTLFEQYSKAMKNLLEK